MRVTRSAPALLMISIGVLAVGCFERTLRPVNPCTRSNVGETIRVTSVEQVDLLMMIDNSNSMLEEQTSLAAELPDLVRILASGDNDMDGTQDFQPVSSLHIGVITSDMGTGNFRVATCDRGTFGVRFGDDGVLITRGRVSMPGCMAAYPSVFEFMRGGDPNRFATDVACVATVGTGGCGFEQQLEATLKALSPNAPQSWTIPGYNPPIFFESTLGHANVANAGFIREESALAILMFTDEEDCSAQNPDLFNPMSTQFPGDSNLRCFMYPEAQHPIERYVRGTDGRAGLIGLRENPALLIFGAIIGVPPDSVGTGYEAILAHSDMQERLDPDAPPTMPRLIPSCNVPMRGVAYPPRRIVRTAQALEQAGASVTVQSICQASYRAALNEIIEKIANALGGACLPRDLNPDAEGFVGCQVFEIQPASAGDANCEALGGRTDAGFVTVNGEERKMCEVTQVGPLGAEAGEQGWFYQTAEGTMPGSDIRMLCGDEGQRIRFTITPTTNSDVRLECLQTVAPSGGGVASIGSFCTPSSGTGGPAATCTAGGDCASGVCSEGACQPGCAQGFAPNRTTPLTCDAVERTCAVPCSETADCTSAGLLGDVCDTRSWEEAAGATDPTLSDAQRQRLIDGLTASGVVDVTARHPFCVNPTCI